MYLYPRFPICGLRNHHSTELATRPRSRAADSTRNPLFSVADRLNLACWLLKRSFLHLSAQPQPFPRANPHACHWTLPSSVVRQRWWHAGPLDSLKDGREQITRHGHLGHPGGDVPDVPNDPRPDLDHSRRTSELPGLYAIAKSRSRTRLFLKLRQESRVHLTTCLPPLIHRSALLRPSQGFATPRLHSRAMFGRAAASLIPHGQWSAGTPLPDDVGKTEVDMDAERYHGA